MNTRYIRTALLTLVISLLAIAAGPAAGASAAQDRDADLIKKELDRGGTLAGYRKADLNRDGTDDFIVLVKSRKGPMNTESLRVFLQRPKAGTFDVKNLRDEVDLTCSDVEFLPGPKGLSAIISIWTPGGTGGGIPLVFFVLGDRFVTYTGFQQVGEQNFSILREDGRVFLISNTPVAYHRCGVPFSPHTVYYSFSGNLFYQVDETFNDAATPEQRINQAAYYFIGEEYGRAAALYRSVHEAITAGNKVNDETIDLVVESHFYEAKSLELGRKAAEAREAYRRLVNRYPEHWMAEAARGELEAMGN